MLLPAALVWGQEWLIVMWGWGVRSCGNPKFKVRGEEGICQQLSGGAGGGGKVGHNCKVMFSGGGGRVGNDCKVINVTAKSEGS